MSDRERDPELTRVTAELTSTVRELRDELTPEREQRGPLGLPRPPTPRELLRFTDEYTIPTLIALLEANLRALEALQGAIRLTRTGQDATDRGREARARTEAFGLTTLDRFDDVLADLQDALVGRPEDTDARTLLEEARTLRGEIDDRLREANGRHGRTTDRRTPTRDSERRHGASSRDDAPQRTQSEDGSVAIDVESELDSIREAVDEEADEDE